MRPATHDKTAGNSLKGKLRRRIGKSPVRNMDVCLQKPDESVNFAAELLIKHTVIMKKFTSLSAIIMMMAMAFTFVSCDDDEYIADTLWGVWQGDMHVWNEWNGNCYESHDTEIAFDRNPYEYSSGSGYWVDFYSRAPWDYFASNITWTVDNGRITIYSYEDDRYYYIYDYSLSDNYFRGTIESDWGDPMDFRLHKVSSPRWDGYDWGWGDWHGYSDPWYSASKSRSGDAVQEKPVRHIGKIN